MDQKIGESTRQMNDSVKSQLGESANLIREVTKGLVKLDETNRQVVSFADQLQNLQDILKNPKQRGILGEYYLETLLKNVLPPGSFQMQYAFKDGTIVDAAVQKSAFDLLRAQDAGLAEAFKTAGVNFAVKVPYASGSQGAAAAAGWITKFKAAEADVVILFGVSSATSAMLGVAAQLK